MSETDNRIERTSFKEYRVSDIAGIILMIIPFMISITRSGKRGALFWSEHYTIRPNMQTGIIACAIYLALVIRYDFFRKDSIKDIMVSSIRALLNIWVMAAFLQVFMPADKKLGISISILAILFSWLGMKSLAGYSWIILIVFGSVHSAKIIKDMGSIGAMFVILITISLLLQVRSVSDLSGFWQDFYVDASKASKKIGDDINMAAEDTKNMADKIIK